MRMSRLGQLLSVALVPSFALLSLAADKPGMPAGMLEARGKVQVNGVAGPVTTALLLGDVVETYDDSAASITTARTSILLMPNSSVELDRNFVELRHGDVVIATSNAMAVTADDLTIMPATHKQSKFEIAENEDSVTVAARQGALNLIGEKENSMLQEGQQRTRKKRKKKAGAAIAAYGPVVSAKDIAILAGAAEIATAIFLIVDQEPNNCVSPAGGSNCKGAP